MTEQNWETQGYYPPNNQDRKPDNLSVSPQGGNPELSSLNYYDSSNELPNYYEQNTAVSGGNGAAAEPYLEEATYSDYYAIPQQEAKQPQNEPSLVDPYRGTENKSWEKPARPKRKKLLLIMSALLVVLLVTAVMLVKVFDNTKNGPQAQADKFLQAIVSGKASEAVKYYSPTGNLHNDVLLQDNIYKNTKNRPSSFEIISVDEEKNQATVSSNLIIKDKKYPFSFNLQQSDNKWQIIQGDFGSITFNNLAEKLVVNGVEIDMSKILATNADTHTVTLPAFPGEYEIEGRVDSPYLMYGSNASVQVLPASINEDYGNKKEIDFEIKFTQRLYDDLVTQTKTRIDGCLPSREFRTGNCNHLDISEPSYAVTAINRYWRKEPSYELAEKVEPEEDGAFSGVFYVKGGDLRIDYKWRYEEGETWKSDFKKVDPVFGSSYDRGFAIPFTVKKDNLEIKWGDF